jgi:hypothetical protein
MFKIILGLSIILAITLLTIFVLSIQHTTFKDTTTTTTTDTKTVKKDTSIPDTQPEKTETTQLKESDVGEDALINPLHHKEPKDKKCCAIQKFDCANNIAGCVSGVEKRCGIFAQKSCEEPMFSCEVLDKDACMSYPTNVYCEYDSEQEQCISNTINSHGGSDISCDTFNTFVNDHNYPNMKYNCENNLIAF